MFKKGLKSKITSLFWDFNKFLIFPINLDTRKQGIRTIVGEKPFKTINHGGHSTGEPLSPLTCQGLSPY